MKTKSREHRRYIRISVCLPVTVELVVGTDDDPNEDPDWEILEVMRTTCEASPRMVEENLGDTELVAMRALVSIAKDIV